MAQIGPPPLPPSPQWPRWRPAPWPSCAAWPVLQACPSWGDQAAVPICWRPWPWRLADARETYGSDALESQPVALGIA